MVCVCVVRLCVCVAWGGVRWRVCCVCVLSLWMWSWMITTLWRWMSLWALRKENCSTVFPFVLQNVRFTLLQICATLNNVHTYTNTAWASVLFSVWNCFTTLPFGITMIFSFFSLLYAYPRRIWYMFKQLVLHSNILICCLRNVSDCSQSCAVYISFLCSKEQH